VQPEVEALIVRMARENSGWGYDRIVGALANLGHHVSNQTVGNILRRHGIAPAAKRSQITTWTDFLAAHIRERATCCFSQSPRQNQNRQAVRCATTIVWADSSNTMSVPDEYFDHSGTMRVERPISWQA